MRGYGVVALMSAVVLLTGCGVAGLNCGSLPMNISPASVTLDHSAVPPGNQQQFIESPASEAGCATAAFAVAGPLTSSDPLDVTVSQFGVATCVNATAAPVTLSSSLTTKTATLTCK